MIELPNDDPTNPIKLADWLEIYTLLVDDKNTSTGNLESALRTASFNEVTTDDSIERKILEVFTELALRQKSSGPAYPYEINAGVLSLKSEWKSFTSYIFCLLLSYFNLEGVDKGAKLFETISCFAAKGYLQGNVLGFGHPRIELSSSFLEAIDELCTRIGEGKGFRIQRTLSKKDDKVDLVAWKEFHDLLPSKIILFGQCGSGRHWDKKLGELNPKAFCEQWMIENPLHLPLKSFFVPHRIDLNTWDYVARNGGIVFDRCRIAYWASQESIDPKPFIRWISKQLTGVKLRIQY